MESKPMKAKKTSERTEHHAGEAEGEIGIADRIIDGDELFVEADLGEHAPFAGFLFLGFFRRTPSAALARISRDRCLVGGGHVREHLAEMSSRRDRCARRRRSPGHVAS